MTTLIRLTLAITIVVALSSPGLAAQDAKVFSTPEEAAKAFVDACERHDAVALTSILGSAADELIRSGDAVQDTLRLDRFVRRAKEALRVEADPFRPGQLVITVGKDGWPAPLPIVKAGAGYRFDASAAKAEILARRIGRNELNAIATLRDLVQAEQDYAYADLSRSGVHEYAQQIPSDPGRRNGLYWEAVEGEASSPLSAIVTRAAAQGYEPPAARKPMIHHGYLFRILTSQGRNAAGGARDYVVRNVMIGGFALVAYPVDYGASGVKTFVVNHDGVVWEKDLGPRTTAIASAMRRYSPDKTWKSSPQEPAEEH